LFASLLALTSVQAASLSPVQERGEIVVTGERTKRTIRDTASSVEIAALVIESFTWNHVIPNLLP